MNRKDKLDPRCGIYEITPAIAEKLLAAPGARNRPPKVQTVERYARRLRSGLWRLSGEPILLNLAGELLDGEQRLRACIMANKPFESVVLFGEFQFLEMGQGRNRNGGDAIALGIPDASNYVAMSAVAGLCIKHDRCAQNEWSLYSNTAVQGDIDNRERVNWCKRNPRAADLYVEWRRLSSRESLLSGSPTAAAWYLAERATSPEEARAFFEPLITGAKLEPGDVRLALRRNISQRGLSGRPSRPQSIEFLHFLAKAWAGRNRKDSWKIFGVKRTEEFPFIR